MNKKYLVLIQNINSELDEISKTVQRAKKAWTLAIDRDEPLYLDSVALSLHDFYNGLERIFERIAVNVDEFKPGSINWHQEILKQMAIEIPNIRPAVISKDLKENLDEYRAFRHIVRNIYSHNFRTDKMKSLIENIDKLFNELENSIQIFCEFLKSTE
jgi:hypothetical protein